MRTINKVLLLGNLGADPELKTLQGGKSVANFSIATTEKWKDSDGTWQESTAWHRCVAWNFQAEECRDLAKGSTVFIEGKIQTRSWTGSDQIKRYVTEIIVDNINKLS